MVGTQKVRAACVAFAVALFTGRAGAETARARVDLNGRWEFRLDPENTGLAQKWYAAGVTYDAAIKVPGAWQAQGVGKPGGNLRHNYEGTAWYRKTVAVPETWRGKDVLVRIAGAHRRATMFVNGVELGGHDGFSSPFEFLVTSAIRPGADNQIVLRIENPAVKIEASPDKQEPLLPTGMLNYIGNWGGIYGDVTLEAVPRTRVASVVVIPDVDRRQVTFRLAVRGEATSVRVRVLSAEATAKVSGGDASATVSLPNAPLWTPDDPRLLTATVEVLEGGRAVDTLDQRFGFRQFAANGNALLLNGKPIYLRGYGDDNVEVLNGFPPPSRDVFVKRLKLAKSYGFNAVRFHSMVPPEAYFEAADEVGILVMAELPAAYTQYFFAHRDFLKQEMRNVLLAHRNHPSLLTLAFGNEFNLRWLKTDANRKVFLDAIADFYAVAKQLAPATLIMSNDGFDMRPTDMVSMYRGFPKDRPVVRHEFGQYYCSLPDIALIDKFTGVIEPEWLITKKAWVMKNSLEASYPIYLRNSQRLQQLGRKFQIERARANPDVSGYHYWLLVDYPGGTGEGDSWEEGWFNYFWEPKVKPEEGRELNSPVLLMIDADVDQRTLWTGERKTVGVSVSNYGPDAVRNGRVTWALMDGGDRVSAAEITGVNVPLGAVAEVGKVQIDAHGLTAAKKLDFVVTLHADERQYTNRWSFWAYPEARVAPTGLSPIITTLRSATLAARYPWIGTDASHVPPGALLVTETLDRRAVAHLRAGGNVWVLLEQTPDRRGVQFFAAAGGAFGTVIREGRPFGGFPHEGFCDLQFYNLVHGAFPLPVDNWPANVNAIVGGIRTTSEFLSKTKNLSRVAYALEGKVGSGNLLITTFRLREHMDVAYPEAIAMFDVLLRYAAGPEFSPTVAVPEAALERLMAD